MNTFKPMLAAPMKAESNQSIETLTYPTFLSTKFDGIRCVVRGGKLLSRSLKPIQNRYINSVLGKRIEHLEGLDGELMINGTFQDVTSGVMSRDGEPDFTFYVFDQFLYAGLPYVQRYTLYQEAVARCGLPEVKATMVFRCSDPGSVVTHLDNWLAEGYEGAIARCAEGMYKFGRSTWKEQGMIKIKPFEDAEATIIGFEEQMENMNEATKDELGHTKRSSHKANKKAKGTLGNLIVRNREFGTFRVGTGFDDKLRKKIWLNRDIYEGATITFRFQRIGMKDKPRIPAFKGLRHKDDM